MMYFIMENGKGAYIEAEENDSLCKRDDIVMCPKKPDHLHDWDNNKKEWILNLERKNFHNISIAKKEIDRLVKFLLIEEKAQDVYAYIKELKGFIADPAGSFPSMPHNLRDEALYE